VRIVRFIKRAQQLGFRLDEVESLLEMAAGSPECCEAGQRLAQHRIAELDQRIADLRALRGALQRLLATCTMPSVGRVTMRAAYVTELGAPETIQVGELAEPRLVATSKGVRLRW
jgi:MerR-like DNA binding protein